MRGFARHVGTGRDRPAREHIIRGWNEGVAGAQDSQVN